MATSSENAVRDMADLQDFETNIDEKEAENDLRELVLSDDELFVDLAEYMS